MPNTQIEEVERDSIELQADQRELHGRVQRTIYRSEQCDSPTETRKYLDLLLEFESSQTTQDDPFH